MHQYNAPVFCRQSLLRYIMYTTAADRQKQLFPPPLMSRSSSFSTAPASEEELAAARNVLRSVISSTRSSPRPESIIPYIAMVASVPPLPKRSEGVSVGIQTDPAAGQVSLEGLVRAAGLSIANFASEIKSLERRIDMQKTEFLEAISELKRN